MTHVRHFPSKPQLGRFFAINNGIFGGSQISLNGLLERRNVACFPITEIFIDDFDGMVVVYITCQNHSHIIRTIVGLIELLDILQARVLEVILRTEHRVLAVRDIGIEQLVDSQIHFLHIHRGIHIELLINGLQFGVETAHNEILETV